MTENGCNRHPVDELADVRTEMKRLEAREAVLKAIVLTDGCKLDGDDFEATVSRSSVERVDTTAVRKHLGEDGIRPFLKQSEIERGMFTVYGTLVTSLANDYLSEVNNRVAFIDFVRGLLQINPLFLRKEI